LIDAKDNDDDSPLHKAALCGRMDCVKFLLTRGVDINAQGCSCRTPLVCAANEGHTEIVALLLNSGALIEIEDTLDETALHKAATIGNVDLLRLLLTTNMGGPRNINAKNVLGSTPLSNAAHRGHIQAVQILLAHGANPLICDDFGYLPKDVALHRNNLHVAELLANWFEEKGRGHK